MISSLLLFPYYLTLKVRNRLYDKGVFKSTSFDVPVFCIGNITVGGTGKTPMAEYIIRTLTGHYRVALLSRGYGRRTKGFIEVSVDDDAHQVGDEPLQIKRKFPEITVAVDADRNSGVEMLLAMDPQPEVILLDDGFQHRSITPSKNIVLIDYNRPIFKDQLMPIGRLRDLPGQVRRADAVVITKSPDYANTWDCDKVRKANKLKDDHPVFFSKIIYGSPRPVFEEYGDPRYKYSKEVYLFTGIANVKPMRSYLYGKYDYVYQHEFPDHHDFTRRDFRKIRKFAAAHPRALLLTSEKDAQRLTNNRHIPDDLKLRMFHLPIETDFLTPEEGDGFLKFLLEGLPVREGVERPIVEPPKEDKPAVAAALESLRVELMAEYEAAEARELEAALEAAASRQRAFMGYPKEEQPTPAAEPDEPQGEPEIEPEEYFPDLVSDSYFEKREERSGYFAAIPDEEPQHEQPEAPVTQEVVESSGKVPAAEVEPVADGEEAQGEPVPQQAENAVEAVSEQSQMPAPAPDPVPQPQPKKAQSIPYRRSRRRKKSDEDLPQLF